jgi:short-subunit dehydrogenase
MPYPSISGAVTVITGASAGIGRAAAHEFARAGARVVLAARDRTRLEEAAREIAAYQPEVLAVPTDVTDGSQVRRLIGETRGRFGRIDILICNAGVGLYSPVEEMPEEALRRIFEVNFFGVVRCVQEALPSMREQGSGLIQFVSSVIGKRAIPGYSGYCATKSALGALAESMRLELAGTGVLVQTVYPGLTETGFSRNAIIRRPGGANQRMQPMSAEIVARHMLRAARRGSRDHMVTVSGKALSLGNALAPGLVDQIMAYLLGPGGTGAHNRRR